MSNDILRGSDSDTGLPQAFTPRLLIEPERAHRIFIRNLRDVLLPRRMVRRAEARESPEFWSDVFVSSGLPWWRFLESFAVHALVLAGVWGASRAWLLRPQVLPPMVFSKHDVIYFPASEYLPPLDTGNAVPRTAEKGEPVFSKQAIISVPPEADNRRQTVVTAPDIKLNRDVPLPNVVAWDAVSPAVPVAAVSRLQLPLQPSTAIVAPPPIVEAAAARHRLDLPSSAVIAPPPDASSAVSLHMVVTPQAAIIEPPPVVEGRIRRVGDINIGHSEIIPPPPQLPTSEQRMIAYQAAIEKGNVASDVIPPPPSVHNVGASRLRARAGTSATEIVPPPPAVAGSDHAKNRIVALNLQPVAVAPPIANGNRRGTFATAEKGKPGAAGTPNIQDRAGRSNGAVGSRSGLPPGLLVKPEASAGHSGGDANSNSNPLVAKAEAPLRVGPAPRRAMVSTSAPTEEEREVFGNRRLYSMILNMPNLNSAGGSWVIRFAELKNGSGQGDLMAPEATRKVDPAYPLELMRTQIQGKVMLYAVIRSDGSVGEVRVLNSVDERLDEYARVALSRWHFRPATKGGSAVDLEAVVTIPFRAQPAF